MRVLRRLVAAARSRYRPTRRQRTALAVLIAVAVIPPLLTRGTPFLTGFQARMIATGACFAAMALSLNILMGYAGQISLGHAAFLGVGAYTSGILTGRYGLAFIVALPVAIAAGALIALIAGLPALRLRGLYLAISTIGLVVMMERSIFQIPWISRGSAGVELPRPVAGDFVFTENADYLALVLVFLVLMWLLDHNIVRTRLGRAFHAIREDEQVAQSFGVDTPRYKLQAFVIAGALAGVAGMLYGHLIGFVDSRVFSYQFSLLLVALVVVGGLGSRVGVVTAAAAFGVLPRLLRFFEGWDLLIGSFLLIFTMARHPTGVAGAIREVREAKHVRRARAGLDEATDPDAVPKLPDMPRPAGLPVRAASADGPVLEVSDVAVSFGGLRAVDGAGLAVPQGKIVGLIGPNGAGKTTLFNAVSGFVKMQHGTVRFLGQEIQHLPPHTRASLGIGRTFQLVGLAKNLSVLENLLLAQHPLAGYGALRSLFYTPRAGRAEAEMHERARAAIAALGFEEYADTPIRNLSGGQQRIVEIASALVTAPELLMLDEPSAGMAPAAVESLAERLRDLRDELGRTVLLIEHHIPLVLDVCDEVYVLNLGRILAHGTPDEIASHPEVIGAYLGDQTIPAEVVTT